MVVLPRGVAKKHTCYIYNTPLFVSRATLKLLRFASGERQSLGNVCIINLRRQAEVQCVDGRQAVPPGPRRASATRGKQESYSCCLSVYSHLLRLKILPQPGDSLPPLPPLLSSLLLSSPLSLPSLLLLHSLP